MISGLWPKLVLWPIKQVQNYWQLLGERIVSHCILYNKLTIDLLFHFPPPPRTDWPTSSPYITNAKCTNAITRPTMGKGKYWLDDSLYTNKKGKGPCSRISKLASIDFFIHLFYHIERDFLQGYQIQTKFPCHEFWI